MTTIPNKTSKFLLGAVALLTLTACEATTRQGATDTDDFLRNALDTYGVIDVVPSAPLSGTSRTASTEPLDATNTARSRPTLTVEQACAGKTGIQRQYRDTRTGQPLDCGPAATPTS